MSTTIQDNQMHIHCKRLYHGKVDIRSYELKDAFEKKLPIVFHVEGETMTMTLHPHEFNAKALGRSDLTPSKYGGPAYRLISYRWVPDKYTQLTLDQQESASAQKDQSGVVLMNEQDISQAERERLEAPFGTDGWRPIYTGDDLPFPNP